MIKKANRAHTIKFTAILLVILAIAAQLVLPVGATEPEETVSVGCFPLKGFFEIAGDGSVSGYGAEYTNAVASIAGWNCEYVRYASWEEALKALSRGEIDIVAPAQHTPERDAEFEFDAFPIGTEYGALLTLSSNEALVYEDYAAFSGLKVGCVKSLIFLDDFLGLEERNGFSVELAYYKDTPALINALNSGEVDAILANLMVKTDTMKLLERFGASPFYYMLSPTAGRLQEELGQAIDKLSSRDPDFQNQLEAAWFSDISLTPFSKEELDYIACSQPLKAACGGDYAPFSFVNAETGEIDGVDRAILQRISEISGLKFTFIPMSAKGADPDFIRDSGAALIAGVETGAQTERSSREYTEPYLEISKYFIGLDGTVFDPEEPMAVAAVCAEEAQLSNLQERFPAFTFIRKGSVDECLESVRRGEADMILDNHYSMENILASPRNQDLHIIPSESFSQRICFKLSLDENGEADPILSSILNKSIMRLTASEKEVMLSDYAQATRYRYDLSDFLYQYRLHIIFAAFAVLAVVLALIFVYSGRHKAQRAIAENELKLRHITNNINGGVIVLRANEGLEITFANDGFLELIGCTRELFEQKENGSYLAYVHSEDLHKLRAAISSEENELSMELRVMKSDGSFVPALFSCTVGTKLHGEKEFYCVIMDLTEQNRLMEQLKIENRRTELILDKVEEIFYEVNLRDKTIITSPSFLEKLGWTLPDRLSQDASGNFEKMWRTDEKNAAMLHGATRDMLQKKGPVSTMVRLESALENRLIWCEILQHPILGEDGSVASVIGLIRDVDSQVEERERLIEQAQRDPLTGLYNKETFEAKVNETLAQQPGQNHALIFVDLDHFKNLNDTLGHMVGDRAICEVADKLRVMFSNYDVISRFGGDEFCIFVKNTPMGTLWDKAEWMVEKLRADYRDANSSVHITCSCGVACTEVVGFEYDTLMTSADKALYYSKENGRDRFTFFRDIPA